MPALDVSILYNGWKTQFSWKCRQVQIMFTILLETVTDLGAAQDNSVRYVTKRNLAPSYI